MPHRRCSAGENSASARAAATNISLVTRRALEDMMPRPTPGKMNELLHWPTFITLFSNITAGNGLPVAISARPPVQLTRSMGSASHLEVGFDSGKIMGLGA